MSRTTGHTWRLPKAKCLSRVTNGSETGQAPIAKWPEGCFALLVPDPFSSPAKHYAIAGNALLFTAESSYSKVNLLDARELASVETC